MKNRKIVLAMVIVLGFACTLSCSPPPAGPLFQDKFEYATAAPWTPANGWTRSHNRAWNITAGGVTGNALEFPDTSTLDGMISSYTGADYTVSARVKVLATNGNGWPITVVARYQDADTWYAAGIDIEGANIRLTILRNTGMSFAILGSVVFKAGSFDSSIYYTLTIRVHGTEITATCSDSVDAQTATVSDTSPLAISSGRAGVFVWTNPGAHVLFDDFIVTNN